MCPPTAWKTTPVHETQLDQHAGCGVGRHRDDLLLALSAAALLLIVASIGVTFGRAELAGAAIGSSRRASAVALAMPVLPGQSLKIVHRHNPTAKANRNEDRRNLEHPDEGWPAVPDAGDAGVGGGSGGCSEIANTRSVAWKGSAWSRTVAGIPHGVESGREDEPDRYWLLLLIGAAALIEMMMLAGVAIAESASSVPRFGLFLLWATTSRPLG